MHELWFNKFEWTRKMTWTPKGKKKSWEREKSLGFVVHDDRTLRFQNRLCVPKNMELRKKILEEAHNTQYSVHAGDIDMYKDLTKYFWWNNIKKEIGDYVDKYLICQKVKAKHQHLVGELRPLEIPTWK